MRFIKHIISLLIRILSDVLSSLYLYIMHLKHKGCDVYYCVHNMGEVAISLTYIPSNKPIIYILRKDKEELTKLYRKCKNIDFEFVGKFVFWFLSKQTSYSFFSNCESISGSRISAIGNDKIVNLEIYSGNYILPRLGLNAYQLYKYSFSDPRSKNGYVPTFDFLLPQKLSNL